MKLAYTVHRINRANVDQEVTLPSGEVVTASVPSAEVEMIADGHAGGTIVLRPVGADANEAVQTFSVGQTVYFTPSLS